MHLFHLLLVPQIAVSCGFIYPSSLADKHFCPKWKKDRVTEECISKSIQRGSVRENVYGVGSVSFIYGLICKKPLFYKRYCV